MVVPCTSVAVVPAVPKLKDPALTLVGRVLPSHVRQLPPEQSLLVIEGVAGQSLPPPLAGVVTE